MIMRRRHNNTDAKNHPWSGKGRKNKPGGTSASTGQPTERLLKLIASLESYNAALCDKLAQAEMDLAALKQRFVFNLPCTESQACAGQSCGWERKLTRMQWRPI